MPVGKSFMSNGMPHNVTMVIPSTLVVSVNSLRSHTGVSGTQSAENAEAAALAFYQGMTEVTIDDPGYIGNQSVYVGMGHGAIKVNRRGRPQPSVRFAVSGAVIVPGGMVVPVVKQSNNRRSKFHKTRLSNTSSNKNTVMLSGGKLASFGMQHKC